MNERLRKFTKDDWNTFPGCESKLPMICNDDAFFIIIKGEKVRAILILDGCDVSIETDETAKTIGQIYFRKCIHFDYAKDLANLLCDMNNIIENYLITVLDFKKEN